MRVVGLSLFVGLLLCASAFAEESDLKADYPSLADAQKDYNTKTNGILMRQDGTWLEFAYPKGGRTLLVQNHRRKIDLNGIELRFLDLKSGKISFSDYFTRRLDGYPKLGSIIAYPYGDFTVERKFTYLAKNNQGYKSVFTGLLVSVKVILGYPAGATKLPTELVCCKTVENLAKAGMPIPDTVGKAGKIKSLLDVAKLRFGAGAGKVFTQANDEGKVFILLFDADSKRAKESVIPATY